MIKHTDDDAPKAKKKEEAPAVQTVKMVKSRAQVGNSGPTELDVLPHHVQQHIEAGWKIKE